MLTKHLTVAGLLLAVHWGAAHANRTWTPKGNILGKLCGKEDREGRQYLGIPYAQPPVGMYRFAAPQPYDQEYPESGWNGTYHRSACPQRALAPGFGVDSFDEDCLFLNVYVPFKNTLDLVPFPVRVWIYGGGFYMGSSSEELYDGCPSMATNDTILVTVNYRLGALGFLALPGLFDEKKGVGNYGLQDQQLALRWVNENIQYFGGDPNSVAIFGESAGGTSVYAQMVAKGSHGLFSRAISQSGPTVEIPPLKTGYRTGKAFAQMMNCTTLGKGKDSNEGTIQCLRAASVEKLLSFHTEFDTAFDGLSYSKLDVIKFGPIVDGVFLPEQIIDAFAGGRTNKGPNGHPITFMAGATKDEATTMIMALANSTELSASKYTKISNILVPGPYREAASIQYNPAKFNGSRFHAAANLLGDYMFQCPARRILAAHWSGCDRTKFKQGTKNCKTYGYHYTHAGHCLFLGPPLELGVPHAAELPYLFNTPTAGMCAWDENDQKFSETLISSWNHFARTGDPSVPGTHLSHWPTWTPKKPRYGILTVPASIEKTSLKEKCKIFDEMAGWKGA